jgi:hypothetical protein
MVSPATLTVTANNATKVYGQGVTSAGTEFTTSGLVNGDAVSGVTLTSAGATATAPVAGSPYAIVPSAAVGTGVGNYTITYVNGTLTVNPAATTTAPVGHHGSPRAAGDVHGCRHADSPRRRHTERQRDVQERLDRPGHRVARGRPGEPDDLVPHHRLTRHHGELRRYDGQQLHRQHVFAVHRDDPGRGPRDRP